MNTADDTGPSAAAAPLAESHLLALPYHFLPGAAIFDCDGTLADTMPLHYRAWCDTLADANCPFPEDTFYAWGGVTAREIVERLNAAHGLALDPHTLAHSKENRYRALIPRIGPIALVVDEVRRLHERDVPLAVASGGMRAVVEETLEVLGLRTYFRTVVGAEDVARGKPEPDGFLLAAERLGVAPERCVVYEDSPPGLEAARRAGMRAVDVRPHLAPRAAG
jgi:HAD superfamily hydrolase (TIGR01509 family)